MQQDLKLFQSFVRAGKADVLQLVFILESYGPHETAGSLAFACVDVDVFTMDRNADVVTYEFNIAKAVGKARDLNYAAIRYKVRVDCNRIR